MSTWRNGLHRRRTKSLLAAWLPIAGSLVVLAAWMFQQTVFDDANTSLNRLNAAEASFEQFRGLVPLFASLRVISPEATQTIARFQNDSYMTGIALVKEALSGGAYEAARKQFTDAGAEESPFIDGQRLQESMILRLALSNERARLSSKKQCTQSTFWAMNLLGTLLIILGSVAKATDEPSEAKEPHARSAV